jgi:hypothetical protein
VAQYLLQSLSAVKQWVRHYRILFGIVLLVKKMIIIHYLWYCYFLNLVLLATKSDLQSIKKYQVSILGDYQEVINEKRLPLIKQMRKNKSKQQK